MQKIEMQKIEIQHFTSIRERGITTLSSELSQLEYSVNGPLFQDIYPDAADKGLIIVGKQEVTFYIHDTKYDELENELLSYELRPTSESIRKVPACKNVRVVIFND